MKIEQRTWTDAEGWSSDSPVGLGDAAQFVLAFGSISAFSSPERLKQVSARYPKASLLGCSTGGEICGARVFDDSLTTTAVRFDRSEVQIRHVDLSSEESVPQAGCRLARLFEPKGLRHLFVLSDGLKVNGSGLARGLNEGLPPGVTVTGGLAGDGRRFQRTLVVSPEGAREGRIAAAGFYGQALQIASGCLGGWDPFGPERLVTRSKGNRLYELDGRSALEIYRLYLGDYAKDLPATGLMFPLSLLSAEGRPEVVRTLLSVDEREQSISFAGDIPEGSRTRLMKANFDRLIDGASGAARSCRNPLASRPPDLAILVSCVGRKWVLQQRIEEEIEAVREEFGESTAMTGMYSYGEISPVSAGSRCELHNQTMTITALTET